MPPIQTAEIRAWRSALERRRARFISVCVAILVTFAGVTLWLVRPTRMGAPVDTADPALAGIAPPGSPLPDLPNPFSDRADAHADIDTSLSRARAEHKRVLLDFGGNWCGDCQVLDIYLHQSPNAKLLTESFLLVHVNIGQYDRNVDLAARYGVPLQRGVPALVVLAPDGKELFVQQGGEFERMAHMQPATVTAFLERWKG